MQKFPRHFYVPNSYKLTLNDDKTGVQVFEGENRNGQPSAMAFGGKRQKPDWHLRFDSVERRQAKVKEYLESQTATLQRRNQRRFERSFTKRKLEVGDILVNSWGYDQTNTDFFEVTALIGDKSVEITPIGYLTNEETGFMSGYCTPAPGKYTGKPIIKRVGLDGQSVKIHSWGSYARKVEPEKNVEGQLVYRPFYWSSYA